MQKQVAMLLMLFSAFPTLGETSSTKDDVKFSGEYLYENISGHWGNYKFHTQTGRTRLWAYADINDTWSYTAMLETTQNFRDDTDNENFAYKSSYLNGRIGGVKLQAGRYEAIFANDAIYDNWVDGIELAYGNKVQLRAFAGKATSANVTIASDTFYGTVPASYGNYYGAELTGRVGKIDLLGGFAKFKNIEYAIVGSDTLHDDLNANFYYLGAESYIAKNLVASARYVKGHLNVPYFNADDYLHDDAYLFSLYYNWMDKEVPGSYDIYVNYYNRGGQTYISETQNIDTFGLSNVAGMGLGIKGYCIGLDYALAKNITTKIEYYNVNSKVANVGMEKSNDSYICSQFFFTF